MLKAARLVFKDARDSAADLRRYFRAKTGPGQVAEVVDDLEAVLITPTHLKDLRNAHVARIWRTAEERLREARRITFIGYSLPGDDLHVKYLFKRALETRPAGTPPPRIVVVDKGNQRTSEVRRNYERFFGSRIVRFHGDGFDEWLATHGPAPARAGRNARPVERRR
jgi:hypothetical protein